MRGGTPRSGYAADEDKPAQPRMRRMLRGRSVRLHCCSGYLDALRGRRAFRLSDWPLIGAIILGILLTSFFVAFHVSRHCQGTKCDVLKRPPVRVEDDETCPRSLGIPKVAFMFLTRGLLFHEDTWRLWFQTAAGKIPLDALRAGSCSEELLHSASQLCEIDEDSPNVIGQQFLFSVYLHPAVGFAGFPKSSIFYGREIPNRVEAGWGSHGLVDATKQLLQAALQSTLNQKFVLLSESGIPLYPPTVIYQQLISEGRSRINACPHDSMDIWRWHPDMNDGQFGKGNWRKSSQWFALTRHHAELSVSETYIDSIFTKHCYSRWDKLLNRWYDCYPDEHQFPSMLSFVGEEGNTDCAGHLMHVDWSRGGPHPMSYSPEDINVDRIKDLRIRWNCHAQSALQLVRHMFVTTDSITKGACEEDSSWSDRLLVPDCPLFARKFPNETAPIVRDLLTDCRSKLDIVRSEKCIRIDRNLGRHLDRRLAESYEGISEAPLRRRDLLSIA